MQENFACKPPRKETVSDGGQPQKEKNDVERDIAGFILMLL